MTGVSVDIRQLREALERLEATVSNCPVVMQDPRHEKRFLEVGVGRLVSATEVEVGDRKFYAQVPRGRTAVVLS